MASPIEAIRHRKHFLRTAAEGKSAAAKGLVLQAVASEEDCPSAYIIGSSVRVGLTVTKKTGNAVERNRIKRRFRVLARHILAEYAKPGFDYVLIGRKSALTRDFAALERDLRYCLHNVDAFKPKQKDSSL